MTDADIARGLRRARLISRIAGLATLVALLFLLLSQRDFDTTAGWLVLYVSVINAAVTTVASLRENSLRREQRRLDREEYRRLMSNQATH